MEIHARIIDTGLRLGGYQPVTPEGSGPPEGGAAGGIPPSPGLALLAQMLEDAGVERADLSELTEAQAMEAFHRLTDEMIALRHRSRAPSLLPGRS